MKYIRNILGQHAIGFYFGIGRHVRTQKAVDPEVEYFRSLLEGVSAVLRGL